MLAPFEGKANGELFMFNRGKGCYLARLEYRDATGCDIAMWGGRQMLVKRNNGECELCAADSIEILGRVVWHGLTPPRERLRNETRGLSPGLRRWMFYVCGGGRWDAPPPNMNRCKQMRS